MPKNQQNKFTLGANYNGILLLLMCKFSIKYFDCKKKYVDMHGIIITCNITMTCKMYVIRSKLFKIKEKINHM